VTPTAGYQWEVIRSDTVIGNANGTPTYDGNAWDIVETNNAKVWKLKAK
jgi:hypothetical protein